MGRWTRRLPAAPLAVALLTLLPAAAGAHATLLTAAPAPGARVEAPPQRLTLGFTEPLNRRLSRATLRTVGGGTVTVERSFDGDRTLVLTPRSRLGDGAYEVEWHAISSTDGHEIEGTYGIGVGVAAASGAKEIEQGPLARGGWLRALAHGAFYVLLLLAAGGLASIALLGRGWPAPGELGGAPEDARIRARALGISADAALGAAALGALVVVIDAARAAGGLSVSAVNDYVLVGTAGVARVAMVVLAAVAGILARRWPRAAAVCAIGALAGVTASGHATSADPRAVALAANFAHLLGAAVWLGGAALVVLTWWPSVRGDWALARRVGRVAFPQLGRIALPAFGLVAVGGAVNALVELGRVSSLWDSGYGRVLAAKIVLVGVIAGVAWSHAYRLRPGVAAEPGDEASTSRLWRWVRAEALLGVGVALLAGLLVAFPLPPHQFDRASAADAGLSAPNCDPCPQPRAARDELAVAGAAGDRIVTGMLRREGAALVVTLRTLDIRRAQPVATPVALVGGGGGAPCGLGCRRFVLGQAPPVVHVRVGGGPRELLVDLPTHWERGAAASRAARALLARAEAAMRGLRSVREEEFVTSGPGTRATTVYELSAPDRLHFRTGGGVQTIQIGRRQWVRRAGEPWTVGPIPGGLAFRTRAWFRWSPYARSLSVLSRRAGRTELALYEPGTPVWLRLTVDDATGRVVRERLVAAARIIDRRYLGFNAPVRIEAPATAIGE